MLWIQISAMRAANIVDLRSLYTKIPE